MNTSSIIIKTHIPIHAPTIMGVLFLKALANVVLHVSWWLSFDVVVHFISGSGVIAQQESGRRHLSS